MSDSPDPGWRERRRSDFKRLQMVGKVAVAPDSMEATVWERGWWEFQHQKGLTALVLAALTIVFTALLPETCVISANLCPVISATAAFVVRGLVGLLLSAGVVILGLAAQSSIHQRNDLRGAIRQAQIERDALHKTLAERSHREVILGSTTNIFSLPGQAFVEVGRLRHVFSARSWIVGVRIAANVPPTGSPLVVDVNKNGTTIFTDQGQRPAIAPGSNASAEMTPAVSVIEAGDHMTIDTDQVGSELPGGDLTIMVRWREMVN